MKNREKFAKEILDIACSGSSIAMDFDGNLVSCSKLNCNECCFNPNSYEDCDINIQKWCESEYVEKPTITSREKNFLDAILPNFKYIARDFNDNLCIYYNKPKRNSMDNYWIPDDEDNDRYYYVSSNMYGNMFDFIKWEDEEPWLIEDLKKLECEGYETD